MCSMFIQQISFLQYIQQQKGELFEEEFLQMRQ